ncbi:hypothetical protein [Aliihoeflea sp. 40Bstr573]|uniref:hypothetical protein n=1 Tax=Aliihoeflea sp. 40Bstr573 TaxID=2696467 RepID=UPI002094D2AE|nr:hypothetical protein [Aliihoeflea sp. 40Bstr573]MCO6387931.1 hypothetical protein [Aliihoeflea sp. 40Bstr573]
MPTKERAARKTRSEQMPSPSVALRAPRSDYESAAGAWEIDTIIDRMLERGIYRYVAPPKAVRWHVRNAVLNADIAARSVYRHRDTSAEREQEVAAWREAIAALEKYAVNLNAEDAQVNQMRTAIRDRLDGLAARPPTQTRDFFADHFIGEMALLWDTIASVGIERPYGVLFEELVTAAWIDGRCPGWDDDDRSRLQARLSKRIAAKRKVWSSDHRGK